MKGELYVCRRCKRIARSLIRDVCDACSQEYDNKRVEIQKYVEEHPGTMVGEIVEKWEVERSVVNGWINEHKLIGACYEPEYRALCRRCGEPIEMGNYCDKCKKLIATELMYVKQ